MDGTKPRPNPYSLETIDCGTPRYMDPCSSHSTFATWINSDYQPPAVPIDCQMQQTISWARDPTVAGGDRVIAQNRDWLAARFPSIYEAPSGWATWPSATTATKLWADHLTYTEKSSKRWHKAIICKIWETIREHWRRTCTLTVESIERENDTEEWVEANRQITQGRRRHKNAQVALDRLIARREHSLDIRNTLWHQERERLKQRLAHRVFEEEGAEQANMPVLEEEEEAQDNTT
jgi:hypothetical protein